MDVMLDHLTSRECKAYLDGGGDLAFVPVGTLERLGPHLPLGARNYVVTAIARILSEKNNGLCLPLIPCSTVYDTFGQRGSMDITPEFIHRYCYDVCGELSANGFKRIIFISFQEELYYLSHAYFQERNRAVIYMHPDSFFSAPDTVAASLDNHGRELWRLAACLRATGNDEMLDRVLSKTEKFFHTYELVINEGRQFLNLLGSSACKTGEKEWRYYPVNLGKSLEHKSAPYIKPDRALPDQARDELLSWLDSLTPAVNDLSTYQEYIDERAFRRPL